MADVAIREQQTGRVSVVPEEQAAALLQDSGEATGYTYEPVAQEERDALARAAYAESGLGMAETAARGAVDWAGRPLIGAAGALMGAEGPLPSLSSIGEGFVSELAGASDYETGQTIGRSAEVGRGLEAANPALYGGAEMVGQIGSALLLPGTQLLEAGAAAGGKVLAGAGATRAGAFLGSAVGRAALQGAGEGAIDVVGRQLMEDPQGSAESILAGAGMGALLGGGAGALPAAGIAGLQAGGRMVGKGAARAGRAVAEMRPKVLGQLSDGLNLEGATAQGRAALLDSHALATGLDRDLLERVASGGPESEIAQRASRTIDDTIDGGAQKVAQDLTAASDALDEVLGATRIADKKLNSWRRQTAPEILNDPRRISVIEDEVVNAGAALENIMVEVEQAIKSKGLNSRAGDMLRATKRQYDRALAEVPESGDAIHAASVLELTKRRMQQAVLAARSSTENLRRNGKLDDFQARDITEIIERLDNEVQEPMRQALMNADVVPPNVAAAQTEINAGYSQQGIRDMAAFRGQFMDRVAGGPDYATGRDLWQVDPAAVKSALSTAGKAEGVLPNAALNGYLGTADNLASLHAKHYGEDMGAQYMQAATTVSERVKSAKEELAYVAKQKGHADDWNAVKEAEGHGAVLGSGAAMLGGLLGGLPGAMVGLAVGAALSPARTASLATQFGGLLKRSGINAGAMRKWASSGAKAVAGAARTAGRAASDVGTGVAAVSRPGATSYALQWYAGENDATPGAAYRKRMKEIQKMDPLSLRDRALADGSVPPAVADALAAKSAQVRDYLLERLPSARMGGAVRPGVPYAPSKAEMDAWGVTVAAALRPQTVLQDIQGGDATPEQVQVVKDLYPRVYQGWQAAALAGLAEADQDGVPVPIASRQRLSMLLGLDGAGDVTMTASFGGALGAAIAAQKAQSAETSYRAPSPSPLGMQAETPAMATLSMA